MPKRNALVGLILVLLIAMAGCSACSGGTASEPEPSAPPMMKDPAPAAPAAPPVAQCKVDTDCACGTDRETHRCAFGPVQKIDTERQCPDFCTGIAGRMKIACVEGTCKQVKR